MPEGLNNGTGGNGAIDPDALQKQAEISLAVALFRLGQALTGGESSEQLQSAHSDVQISIHGLTGCVKLKQLALHFGLDKLELNLLAVVYLFALEPNLMSAYASLSWFERGPGISAERALSICTELSDESGSTKALLLAILRGNTPLVSWRMVVCHDPAHPLHQPLTISASLFHYLSWADCYRPPIPPAAGWLTAIPAVENPATKAVYAKALGQNPARLNLLDGGDETEQQVFLQTLVSTHPGRETADRGDSREVSPMLWLVSDPLPQSGDTLNYFIEAILAARLSALSQPFYLWWPKMWRVCSENTELWPLVEVLKETAGLIVFADSPQSREGQLLSPHLQWKLMVGGKLEHYALDTPTAEQLAEGWLALLDMSGFEPSSLSVEQARLIAERYPVLTAEMADVISNIDAEQTPSLSTMERIQSHCLRRVAAQNLSLASLSLPAVTLADMTLPASIREHLDEIIYRLKYRQQLTEQVPRFVPGAQVLFWGPPGTGKSMAAEAIAGELHLPLYRVNLANVASKWIGETEKHLAILFDVAEKQKAILLFDEADAIFAKRSEVNSSQDKNANMGVSFLLQRMESYQGLLLLSTNFKSNIDDAFLRRLQAVVEFSIPDKAMRLTLWQRAWKGSLQPESEEMQAFLAENFELSPSQIRNIAERAVMYAIADELDGITKDILAKSVLRELEKQSGGFLAGQQLTEWQNN